MFKASKERPCSIKSKGMIKMSNFDELFELWQDYFKERVVKNEHLIRPLFHSFLGIVLPVNIVWAGSYNSLRINIFSIQNSGTGKGQAMKALHFLIDWLGTKHSLDLKSSYTTKMTDAALAGTVELLGRRSRREGGNLNIQPLRGALSKYNLICWDEGDIIFRNIPYMETVRDTLNMAIDEPGWVNKELRLGSIKYPTNTTIVAGSLLKHDISRSVVNEGFLQRMFLIYRNFTEQELDEIDKELIRLYQVNYRETEEKKERLYQKLKNVLDNVNKYNVQDAWSSKKVIRFDESILPEINRIKDNLKKEYFSEQFKDESFQETARSFYSRLHLPLNKIAAQRAIVNLSDNVGIEDFRYAAGVVKIHCESVFNLLENISRNVEFTTRPRENIILDILRNGKKNRSEIIQMLHTMYQKGGWGLGLSGTKNLLKEMVRNGKIKERNVPDGVGRPEVYYSIE